MPTEHSSPVSRRKLGIFGVVAGVGAVLVVVTGIRAREESGAKLREWTDNQAIPTVAVVLPDAKALSRHHRSAGPAGGLFARADLRARQRLPEELERRHRRAGQGRAGDRRNRGAGPRPAIAAGARRSRQPAGQREAVGGDADPPQDRCSPRTSSRCRKSTSAPPTSPTRRPRSIPARPMSSGWRRWRATRRSPCRSTASSPRAIPTSAR